MRDFCAERREELVRSTEWSQVDAALYGMHSIDWALLSWALGAQPALVREALAQAAHALLDVQDLAGTADPLPVVVINDAGSRDATVRADNSLDSAERARLAHHLLALSSGPECQKQARWPGGSNAENAAVAAIARRDREVFLSALSRLLSEHKFAEREPSTFVSLPALALSSRALAAGLVSRDDLPHSELLPRELLPPGG